MVVYHICSYEAWVDGVAVLVAKRNAPFSAPAFFVYTISRRHPGWAVVITVLGIIRPGHIPYPSSSILTSARSTDTFSTVIPAPVMVTLASQPWKFWSFKSAMASAVKVYLYVPSVVTFSTSPSPFGSKPVNVFPPRAVTI